MKKFLLYLCLLIVIASCDPSIFSLKNNNPTITTNLASTESVHAGTDLLLSVVATDQDGDTLSYAWQETAAGGSAFSSVSGVTGAKYTFNKTSSGIYQVRVLISDGKNGSTTSAICGVTVTASNRAPTITTDLASTKYIGIGNNLVLSVAAADQDGDTLSYTWQETAAGGSTFSAVAGVSGASYTFSKSTRGIYQVKVVISDGKDGSATSAVCSVYVVNQSDIIIFATAAPVTSVTSGKTTYEGYCQLENMSLGFGNGDFTGTVVKMNGLTLPMLYNSKNYFMLLYIGTFEKGDTISLSISNWGLPEVSTTVTVPDLITDFTLSPVLPLSGNENTATVYTASWSPIAGVSGYSISYSGYDSSKNWKEGIGYDASSPGYTLTITDSQNKAYPFLDIKLNTFNKVGISGFDAFSSFEAKGTNEVMKTNR